MASPAKAIPEGYHSLTPSLIVKDARAAVAFYQKAFGARERHIFVGPGNRVMHAEVTIGDSILMLADEMPDMGCLSPESLKGSAAALYLYVPDVDAVFDQAVKAGAQVKMPVGDMFWGDRCGTLADPFGHQWTIATHKEDLTPEQMQTRGDQFFATLAKR